SNSSWHYDDCEHGDRHDNATHWAQSIRDIGYNRNEYGAGGKGCNAVLCGVICVFDSGHLHTHYINLVAHINDGPRNNHSLGRFRSTHIAKAVAF
ncbi:MAG: hypothetical protein ACI9WS_002922, partial [Paraglaciecola psychrophila]